MALQFFEKSDGNSTDLEFANDFLKANPRENGKQFVVREIIRVQSGKGFMLRTDYFNCWLWKKSEIAKQLMEALEVYVSSSQGYSLFAVLDNSIKDGFKLAVDTDYTVRWYSMGNGSYSLTQSNITSMESGNPFLPLAPSPIPAGQTLNGAQVEGQVRKARK